MKKILVSTLFLALLFVGGCVVKKEVSDNKSPEAAAPTVTGQEQKMMRVKIYFDNTKLNPNAEDCGQVFLVDRPVLKTEAPAVATLQELFKGPNEGEKKQGYTSWFSDKTADILKSLKVVEGTAYVNLKDIREIIPNASTSCGSAQFLAEVETTLKQYSAVKTVVFAIEGKPATFYEWLQIGCSAESNLCDEAPFKI